MEEVNSHDVPERKWESWGRAARLVFNASYSGALAKRYNGIKPEPWKASAWVAAWEAADTVDNFRQVTV